MTSTEFFNLYDHNHDFTESEILNIIHSFPLRSSTIGDIIEVDDRLFAFDIVKEPYEDIFWCKTIVYEVKEEIEVIKITHYRKKVA